MDRRTQRQSRAPRELRAAEQAAAVSAFSPSAAHFGYNCTVRPIRITRHARNRMRRQRISEELIHVTLRAPEWEEPSVAGRVNRWKRVEDGFLRVTCRDELERIIREDRI